MAESMMDPAPALTAAPAFTAAPASTAALTRLRRHRALVAQRLLEGVPSAAAALSWDALAAAPAWLAAEDEVLLLWQRRVGAVFCAPALRRWIDAPRVQALRQSLGAEFYRALLRMDDPLGAAALPAGLPDWPHAPAASAVAEVPALLRSCGAAVLVCTLPHGALRHAVSQLLAPLAELMMPAPHAQALVQRAERLAQMEGPLSIGSSTAMPSHGSRAGSPVSGDHSLAMEDGA